MAPVAPFGKNRVLALLRAGRLPFVFGSPHPFVAVLEQDGVFRVRELVVDSDEAEAAAKAAMTEGGCWMPEQHYALGKPTGRVFIEAPTRDALAEKLEAYQWPREW
ncbi:hypothetical protein JQX13_45125 [Archangium violaceum]|uniref:hypothetical protein n=1 Tax=Archangium violaceum TaxID=83451 RepID=UPI00193C2052|nr:hypothetical protein [Archangium violaceum]QRK07159.1 hypothetical protein JQX13_45125 [Archangium violaceum]